MPPEHEDYSSYIVEAKKLLHEDNLSILIGNRKFYEAQQQLHKAAIALERASILIARMHFNQIREQTKRATNRDSERS